MKIVMSSGMCYPVSKHFLINDDEFDTDEDVLDYILNCLSTVEVFKIQAKVSNKKPKYILTNQICSIEIE